MNTIVFGGGCFWCVEAQLKLLNGIISITPGYMGGEKENPTYEEVCTGTTGHAEVVKVTFNGQIISFQEIVYYFFFLHDPTQLNRQGNDIGTQYRSVIFYKNEEELKIIQEVIQKLIQQQEYKDIKTEITEESIFYPAEAHHFNYYSQNPHQPYCQLVIAPKVESFKQKINHSL